MRGLALLSCVLMSTGAWAAKPESERLQDAATVFSEVMRTPDKGIPQDLLGRAECVIVIPGMKKAAFVVGAEYGKGFAECRNGSGTGWSAPAAVKLEGGSVGFQLGGSETDLILLVMNRRGMDKLMSDKFTLGADASVAAGPVGRTAAANTDVKMSAEILSWSRAKGLFAGVALNGATLRPDPKADESLYGRSYTNREILAGTTVTAPTEARALTAELDKYSMRGSNADRVKQ